MTKLNKNRPFGRIVPPINQAIYEQDGMLFSADGLPTDDEGNLLPMPEDQTGCSPPLDNEPGPNETTQPPADDKVDLTAWAKGEKNYLWAEVKAAIKEAFGQEFTSAADAEDFILATMKKE